MNHKTVELIGVILVIVIILLPFCWIIISTQPPGTITSEFSVELIEKALKNAGFTVYNIKENTWDVPGALGGMTYIVSSGNDAIDQRNGVIIHFQKFQSEETRDAMIRGFNSQTRGRPNGAILTRGPNIILVQGHGHEDIASVLQKIR